MQLIKEPCMFLQIGFCVRIDFEGFKDLPIHY